MPLLEWVRYRNDQMLPSFHAFAFSMMAVADEHNATDADT